MFLPLLRANRAKARDAKPTGLLSIGGYAGRVARGLGLAFLGEANDWARVRDDAGFFIFSSLTSKIDFDVERTHRRFNSENLDLFSVW